MVGPSKRFSKGFMASWSQRGFGSRGTEGKIGASITKNPGFLLWHLSWNTVALVDSMDAIKLEFLSPTPRSLRVRGTWLSIIWRVKKKMGTKGGSMRLGAYQCTLKKGSLAESLWNFKLFENTATGSELTTPMSKNLKKPALSCRGEMILMGWLKS